jgi:hypothetical protein
MVADAHWRSAIKGGLFHLGRSTFSFHNFFYSISLSHTTFLSSCSISNNTKNTNDQYLLPFHHEPSIHESNAESTMMILMLKHQKGLWKNILINSFHQLYPLIINTITTETSHFPTSFHFLVLCSCFSMVMHMRKIRFLCSTLHLPLLIFFMAILLQRSSIVAESSILNYTKYRQISSLRLERINNHLDKINKPPVLTIEVVLFNVINVIYCMFVCVW